MKLRNKIMIPVGICYFIGLMVLYFRTKNVLVKAGYWDEVAKSLQIEILVVGMLVGLFLMLVLNFISSGMLNSLHSVNKRMEELSQHGGDLTVHIKAKAKDESAGIAGSVNAFIKKIHEMMMEIRESDEALQNSMEQMKIGTDKTALESESISSVMEEINATAAEMASNVAEAANIFEEMAQGFEDINDEAKDGADYAQNSNSVAYDIMWKTA